MRKTTIAEVTIESEEVHIVQRPNRDRCERCGEKIEIENQKEENHVSEERKTN